MPTRPPLRLALTVALTVCLVLGVIPQAVAVAPPGLGSQMLAAPTAEATVVEFKHTGQSQSWQVPDGVTSIRVDVQGAQGGGVYGGFGGRVQATLPLQPGQQLQVNVGGRDLGGNGGFNGGGDAGLGGRGVGGGGASDIRVAPHALADRLVVAGGGGGAAPAATSIFGVGGSAGRIGQAGGNASEDGQNGGGG
ncbi:MAG TPA: glycine-rich protein, partial [Actinomycetes bacterium]|nr:glycine-rich protein [Actinomycetes bacterium]